MGAGTIDETRRCVRWPGNLEPNEGGLARGGQECERPHQSIQRGQLKGNSCSREKGDGPSGEQRIRSRTAEAARGRAQRSSGAPEAVTPFRTQRMPHGEDYTWRLRPAAYVLPFRAQPNTERK